jgi:hypothetical protein
MLNESQLLAADYRKFDSRWKQHCDYLYQKRITDERGTLYFIDVYHYPELTFPNGTNIPESYEAELSCDGKFKFTEYNPALITTMEFTMQLFWENFWGKYYEEN